MHTVTFLIIGEVLIGIALFLILLILGETGKRLDAIRSRIEELELASKRVILSATPWKLDDYKARIEKLERESKERSI